MTEEYQIRYKMEFFPFHNPIDIVFWKNAQEANNSISAKATLLYAGRIGTGLREILLSTERIVDRIYETEKLEKSRQN